MYNLTTLAYLHTYTINLRSPPIMLVNAAITFAAFAISANALQVTAPTNSSGWTTQGAQEIKWDVSDQHCPDVDEPH